MVDTITPSDSQDIDAEIAALSKRGRIWLLTIASADVLLVISSMVALNAAMPDLAVQTSATQAQLTWIIDGYTLALACLLLPAGALGDRYGRRGALLVGLAIFGLASIAPAVLDSPAQIIVMRAIAGIGAAFIMPATLSLLTAAFPKSERNKAVGIWAGVAGSSAIFGFLGTGGLLHFFEWQSIFYAFAAAALALFALTCTIGTSRDDAATPIDWPGAALIGTAVAVLVLGLIEAPHRGWSDVLVLGCLAAGVALAVVFALVELRRTHPLLDVRLFARADFATGAVGITLLFFANFGFFFVAMQYIQLVLGYSPLQSALALAPLAIPLLVLGATMHLYLPRLGLRLTVATGLAFLATGLLCMRFLDADSSFVDLTWPMLIMSVGIGLCTGPTTSAIMGAAPDDKQGVASAVNDTTREVGAAVGIAVAGSLLAAGYHNSITPHLGAFPEPVREAASNSLAYALEVAEKMGPQGASLTGFAEQAFVDAMDLSLLVMGCVIFVAAGLVALWSPGRDGRQLRIVRRLRERGEPATAGRHRA